jgi:hypothetical protein
MFFRDNIKVNFLEGTYLYPKLKSELRLRLKNTRNKDWRYAEAIAMVKIEPK